MRIFKDSEVRYFYKNLIVIYDDEWTQILRWKKWGMPNYKILNGIKKYRKDISLYKAREKNYKEIEE